MRKITPTITILSAVLSFVCYTPFIGCKAALLVLFAVGFHEQCHLWAAQRLKLPTNSFVFIPFVGGSSFITKQPYTRFGSAFISLAGPLGGSMMAVLWVVVYIITRIGFIGVAAQCMLLLNLFNLIPLAFTDGGQIFDAFVYSFSLKAGMIARITTTVLATVGLLLIGNAIIAMFTALLSTNSIISEVRNYTNLKRGRTWLVPMSYMVQPEKMNQMDMQTMSAGYFATIFILLACMSYNGHVLHQQFHGDFAAALKVLK